MAEDININGAPVKIQSIWAILGLSIITFGIYTYFWLYRVNSELKAIGAAYGDQELAESKPGNTVLAFLFGWILLLIPTLMSFHAMGKRIQRAHALVGGTPGAGLSLGIHWLLLFVTGLWPLYDQAELNKTWTIASQPAGAGPATV